jgi:hypothetical protein
MCDYLALNRRKNTSGNSWLLRRQRKISRFYNSGNSVLRFIKPVYSRMILDQVLF